MQTLHEQLSNEHEAMIKEKEELRQIQKNLAKEVKTLKDLLAKQEATNSVTNQELDAKKTDLISFSDLKAEHSKLTVKFKIELT